MIEKKIKTIKHSLSIRGMSCVSCVNKIERALTILPGVRDAKVNFAEKTVTVHSNATISANELIHTIQNVGYEAHLSAPEN